MPPMRSSSRVAERVDGGANSAASVSAARFTPSSALP
jgi:hypothetical protein